MQVPRPTEDDKAYFRAVLPADERVEVKPMFGNLGAFVNSNMFAGLFGSDVGVRLGDADRTALLGEEGSGPFGPAERPMGAYTTLPPAWRAEPEKGRQWTARALAHTAALPPKKARSKKDRGS
jgi:TfoX/Sxy family transcriptional regulator of competence genes